MTSPRCCGSGGTIGRSAPPATSPTPSSRCCRRCPGWSVVPGDGQIHFGIVLGDQQPAGLHQGLREHAEDHRGDEKRNRTSTSTTTTSRSTRTPSARPRWVTRPACAVHNVRSWRIRRWCSRDNTPKKDPDKLASTRSRLSRGPARYPRQVVAGRTHADRISAAAWVFLAAWVFSVSGRWKWPSARR